MSTPRYDWWPYVKGMIRRYPELCRREADLHTTAVTPNYGGAPGGHGGRSDPVANAALRSLPEVNRRELDAVRAAISEELTDLQICIEMLEAAGYHGDQDLADVKRQRMVQRLDEAGK